jgi:polyvinyl alcohol dehydrogenase (cytochrome)
VVSAAETGKGRPDVYEIQPAPPSRYGGAVWAPSGFVVDGAGHVFAATGNPVPPSGQRATVYDESDSLVELSPSMRLLGHFEPASWEQDSNTDRDMASAGPEALPGEVLFEAGKNGTGYLVSIPGMAHGAPALYSAPVCPGAGSFGGDAFLGGVIFVGCSSGVRALTYTAAGGSLHFAARWSGPPSAFGPPIVAGGLVWDVATGGFQGGGSTLYGLDPSTGAVRRTLTLPSPVADHFASPSAAGGGLFVATGSTVSAFQIERP